VTRRALTVAVALVVALFAGFWWFVPTDLDHTDEPIIRAQEATAESLASAEVAFFRRHGRFIAATDSLPWTAFAGMEVVIEAADSLRFRARIISITNTTVEMELDLAGGAPRVARIARAVRTEGDRTWWETKDRRVSLGVTSRQ
jgi:hypothetical protein